MEAGFLYLGGCSIAPGVVAPENRCLFHGQLQAPATLAPAIRRLGPQWGKGGAH